MTKSLALLDFVELHRLNCSNLAQELRTKNKIDTVAVTTMHDLT